MPLPGTSACSSDSPEELIGDLDGRSETMACTVVVDAVDEAIDSRKLLSDLLLPLARRPGLRVIIGARRHVVPLGAEVSLLVDLDSDNYRDPQALADYAYQLLVAAREPGVPTPYRDRDDIAATVAKAIAEKATARPTPGGQAESFLLAQLLARAIRAGQDVLDLTRRDWAEQLPTSVGAAFDEDLLRLGKHQPTARALLTALAWAKGAGLPWETIWVPVAQASAALAGDSAPQLDDAEVKWLLRNAGAYIVEDLGPGGRSVFRPFHDLLAAHLRGEPTKEQNEANPAATGAWQQRRAQAEQAITDALLGTVPAADDHTRDWEVAHPYLLTYLAQHAAAGGLEELLQDTGFLTHADPVTLAPLLAALPAGSADGAADTYRASYAVHSRQPSAGRAQILAVDAARYGYFALARRLSSAAMWQPAWATGQSMTAELRLTLTSHTGRVAAVAVGRVGDREVIVSGGKDGTVQVWDAASGQPVGLPLTGPADRVAAVAVGQGEDREVMIAGGKDGTVQVWDAVSGQPVGPPLTGHNGPVAAVAGGRGPGTATWSSPAAPTGLYGCGTR